MWKLIYLFFSIPIILNFFKKYRSDYVVLMYHRVIKDDDKDFFEYPNKGIVVTESQFEEHMKYLSLNYDVVSIEELRIKNESGKPKIIITFDDGYKDNLKLAFPILKKYNLPAVIYLTTSLIDSPSIVWWYNLWKICLSKNRLSFFKEVEYEYDISTYKKKIVVYSKLCSMFRKLDYKEQEELLLQICINAEVEKFDIFMDWNDIELLQKDELITFGAHAVYHLSLAHLNEERSYFEMIKSKEILEDKLGVEIEHFAYPFGRFYDFSEKEIKYAKAIGYKTCVITECFNDLEDVNLYAYPRHAIFKRHNVNALKMKINGVNNFFKRHL